ncbi:zinc-dependent metalloprotease [Flavobacterium caeni]|nr:zinc-dependent metalloprotease [Flavobacterium caeni]
MKKLLFTFAMIFATLGLFAQSVWQSVDERLVTGEKSSRVSHPATYLLYALNLDALKIQLAAAPSRLQTLESNVIVSFPTDQGDLQKFHIFEASVMHPQLAAQHPEIQSYVGKGIDDPTATMRFSVTPFGLHAMTFSGHGAYYIDSYTKDGKHSIVYSRQSLTTTNSFECNVVEPVDLVPNPSDAPQIQSNNSLFKTYRLAMACTIEYADFHVDEAGLGGGTLEQKKAAVLAAMVITMTRVNGIYERDFALTMELVANNEDVIFIESDNFDNFNTNNILLDQSQEVIDDIIGSANYDIGHTVSTGGGGVAQLQSPCSNSKARGITGLDAPVGDPYDVDYVSHEMGHQWGCSHTFNGDQGGCNGNRTASSAFEPGSGSTIMGYSGLCNSQNVQFFSDPYFHARSLIQGSNFINGGGNCGVVVPNGNTAPTADAGPNHTIPFGTAFVMRGVATDADGDALTYCWEQYDNEIATQPPVATSGGGPNFRTLMPSASPDRYFPKFSDVLAGNLTPTWEVVPNVARNMEFSLVVRDDGSPLGGQTQRATTNVVFANAGPFRVTSQSLLEAWPQNSAQTVTWDVAGTTANGINTALVTIKMSADGGATWPYVLAENTANDGSEAITAPDVISTNCRIMIEAVDNIFYAVNSRAFAVGYEVVTTCNTYTNNTPFALTDGSTAFNVKTIAVPAAGTISDVNITVNATHANIQNLNIAVIRPGGALTNIFNQSCPGSANMNVTFDAEGAPFACASPLAGNMITPTGSLAAMYGFNQQGNWQFGFRDLVAGDAGTINSFALEVCSESLAPLATTQFAFADFALYPNPNTGDFTIRFASSSNKPIAVGVHDMRGRVIYDQSFENNGVFVQDIRLNRAQSGIYLVSVQQGDQKTVKRIVVE